MLTEVRLWESQVLPSPGKRACGVGLAGAGRRRWGRIPGNVLQILGPGVLTGGVKESVTTQITVLCSLVSCFHVCESMYLYTYKIQDLRVLM